MGLAWPVAATGVAILFAIALASRGAPSLSFFDFRTTRCHCAPGTRAQSGLVEDCCCDYETVDHLNEEVLDPLLQELVKTPFFRYFKVKLWCDCPFWPDDGMCVLRDCSVCECPENEFPEPLKRPSSLGLSSDDLVCREEKPEAVIDRTIATKAFRGWTEKDNPWTNDDETDNALYLFTQQSLPACKPVLTPAWVITIYFLIGVICIPVGLLSLDASRSVVEIMDRDDTDCIPPPFKSNKVAYIKDSSISKNCSRFLKVPKHMKAPIYIYYQLDNYYQNHRRYVKSRSDKQLWHGLKYNSTSSCKPEEYNNGLPIVPCGLIAWSLFNDTYSFSRGTAALKVNRKNISWKSDLDHKFGKQVYPFNFQNGSLIGGGSLDPNVSLSDQEDLIVWMSTAALPSFRKLYGRIEEDMDVDDVVVVDVSNNYNTYSFGGKKKLVLSTSSWLGGKNDFLGMAYLSVGSSSILLSLIFLVLHVKNPRPYGDTNYSSWNWKGVSS